VICTGSYRYGASGGSAGTPSSALAGLSLAGSGSVTSPAFTPTVGGFVYICCSSRRNVAPGTFVVSNSLSGTWTSLGRIDLNDGGTDFMALEVFRSPSVASSQTATVACNPSNHLAVFILQIPSSLDDASNVKSATSTTGDPAVTLDVTPSSTSVTLGVFAAHMVTSNTVTPPTGWTELADFVGGTALRMEVIYRTGAAANTATWSTTETLSIGWLVEVKGA
jgi:hypothetical protein